MVTRRLFHDYFVTHLPSSSLHPDSGSVSRPHHKLPRSASVPHTSGDTGPPAAIPSTVGVSREMTVVRIPLQSAKFHFGLSTSRGMRPDNEDMFQAGVIEIPAFAKRSPVSLTHYSGGPGDGEGTSAESASGDPQVFYFGIFDGHGGSECSRFLKDHLHIYIEKSAKQLRLSSSLKGGRLESQASQDALEATTLQNSLVKSWADMVGGYFKRFRPEHFVLSAAKSSQAVRGHLSQALQDVKTRKAGAISVETALTYAFLKADFDFIAVQAINLDEDIVRLDRALNEDEVLGEASKQAHDLRPQRSVGGSTCSVALISTPTPTPFWHPASPSTLITSHVGDTRILLCSTASGRAIPLTTDHHPSSPGEGNRLRRFAATFITDSFGEERMDGLANTRAFGDIRSKQLGVSAEPEIRRVELKPAEYSFLVLVSDGISGSLNDQEIADIVKESKTPEQGAKDVVAFATEISNEGDNATCMVIRLGGWERRIEGGFGAMKTKEVREWKRQEATNPRNRRS